MTLHTEHARHTIDTDTPTVQSWPNYLGYQVTVPVTVELPRELVQACRKEFEDYLWDVLLFEPTFLVDGDEIDTETGRPIED